MRRMGDGRKRITIKSLKRAVGQNADRSFLFMVLYNFRGVAQPGSAHGSGPWCRRFKSSRPDIHFLKSYAEFYQKTYCQQQGVYPERGCRSQRTHAAPYETPEYRTEMDAGGKKRDQDTSQKHIQDSSFRDYFLTSRRLIASSLPRRGT